MPNLKPQPFENCRILDLTGDGRMMCGKIFADLGADVIMIEPPGGSASGRTAPFRGRDREPEKSLFWWSLNANKRGVTLNLDTSEGRELFGRLIRSASIVVESFKPGYLASIGFDYEAMAELNPSVILTSISDFGQDGPYRDYNGSDLVLTALSGYLYLCGDDDRPPVRMSLPQAYFHAGADAAAGAAIRRERGTGC
ncbi:CoA transferase [Thermodesulfobacteriota bacterium]